MEAEEGLLNEPKVRCKDIRHTHRGKSVYLETTWKDMINKTNAGERKTMVRADCLRNH